MAEEPLAEAVVGAALLVLVVFLGMPAWARRSSSNHSASECHLGMVEASLKVCSLCETCREETVTNCFVVDRIRSRPVPSLAI